jgi:hypothetical protein
VTASCPACRVRHHVSPLDDRTRLDCLCGAQLAVHLDIVGARLRPVIVDDATITLALEHLR